MHILLIVLSIAIIATIGTIFYHFVDTQYKTETAVSATAEQSETFQGVYVRDETVLTYNGSGAISYNVPDGGKVEKGGLRKFMPTSPPLKQISKSQRCSRN